MLGWHVGNVIAWYSIFIGVALKSTAVLAVAWLSAGLLRGRSAAARHVVWTAALAAVLALPFLSVSLPALRVRAAAVFLPGPTDAVFQATAAASGDGGAAGSTAHGSGVASFTGAGRHTDWRVWLMLIWLAGFAAAFARMLVAYAAAWRLRRSAKPFGDGALCGTLSRALGIRRAVDVLETQAGSMPMTFGLVQSTILVPSEAAEWSAERRRIVLLHELAHVRRGDAATHLLARAAMNIYWWNPLAWIAWRQFLRERERAADDLVLSAGARASEYAGHLLEVARTLQSPPAIGWAAVAMARRSQLEGRLLAILDSGVNRRAAGRASVLVAALMAVAVIAPLAAVRAQDSQAQAGSQKDYERLENAAKAAAQLRQYGTARKLLESAVAIRAAVYGEQSVPYGVGLMKLAALEEKQNHAQPAEALYAKAAQVLGDQPEAARALTHLGLAAIAKKDFPQAKDYFQHAQRVDPTQAGPALMWMAVAEQYQQHMDDAERLYQSAISVQDPKSVDAAVIMEVCGQFLREQGRADQAGEMEARAEAIQRANAPPASSHPTSGAYKIGAGISPPSVLRKIEPDYSEEARVAKLQGTVVVQVVIGPDGVAHDARIVRGLGLGLDEQAIEAIGQWQFKPGVKDGQPVPVTATIEINWHLL
jgi:TonB family protein